MSSHDTGRTIRKKTAKVTVGKSTQPRTRKTSRACAVLPSTSRTRTGSAKVPARPRGVPKIQPVGRRWRPFGGFRGVPRLEVIREGTPEVFGDRTRRQVVERLRVSAARAARCIRRLAAVNRPQRRNRRRLVSGHAGTKQLRRGERGDDADNRDGDQQLDQRETLFAVRWCHTQALIVC